MKKRWLAMIMAVIMFLSLLPVSALATGSTDSPGAPDSGPAERTGEGENPGTDPTEPEDLEPAPPEKEENVIEVSGDTTWSAIQTKIDAILAKNSDAPVKISGTGGDAVIKMDVVCTDDNNIPELGAALELHSDTTFENVTFQLQGQSSTNTQPNIAMFANGHKLHIADDVKTERVGDYNKSMFIFGGGKKTEEIENTHLEVYGGTWARIYGGSYRSDCGNTYIYIGGNTDVRDVYGGCFGAKTTGNIEIKYGANVNPKAVVNGGGHDVQNEAQIANVTGEKIEIEILSGALLDEVNGAENSMISCGDVYITVNEGASVLSSISGGATTSSAENWSLASGYSPGGTQYIAKSNIHVVFNGEGRRDDTKLYSASVTGGGIWGHVEGSIDVTINGNVEYVYGGSHGGNITGNIDITINGGVYAGGHNADMEIGEVHRWYGGTVTSGCIDGTVTGDITTTINKDAKVHSVIGGSDDGCVVGNTTVHVYGTILKKNYESANRALRYAGSVFGGGYFGEEDFIDVNGKTFVYVHEGAVVEGDVHGGAINGRIFGDTYVEVTGTVNGDVYGGGLNSYGYPGGFWTSKESNPQTVIHPGIVYGNTNVKICGTGTANNVYGSGKAATVGGYIITTNGKSPLREGNTNVLLEGNASVQNVCGTGNPESGRWGRGEYIEAKPSSPTVYGNATITIREQAKVADTVYGFAWFEADDEKYSTVSKEAKVFFRASNNESVFKRVENADLVQVTNGSKVEIDNEHKDNEQLVNVADLTIDNSATLRIGANAHILGNYKGDKAKSGTLEIPAGKCLTADGTVTDLTKISIYDFNSVIPVKAQIYVISGAGSTTESGDFTWVDERNGVYMEWNMLKESDRPDPGEKTMWWLVKKSGGGGGNTKPPVLNTKDHYGYIIGYPEDYETGEKTNDQTRMPVKPEGNITRAEVATIFFRMLTDESRSQSWSQTSDYTDVKATDWYNNAVCTLSNAGILSGYEDGTFHPNGKITRAEFATIASRFFEYKDSTGDNPFSDVSENSWYYKFVLAASEMGLINGYPDGTFGPEKFITRAEACAIVNRTLDRHPDQDHFLKDMLVWVDNMDTTKWYYEDMQEATNSHEYERKGSGDNKYENWTKMLPIRDWAAFEKEWSDANAASGGEVVK